ncbi:hypothetical protein G3I50_09210 [Streptomyces parvus]|uniref:Uncharacterized protein n=1 Tax=Streptomyces parvus TaxID=66428 RepID=A0A7K3RTD6_9ACTN|nr:hypothetical protein [Streptomyces parvus]NEC18434.1 hypothetical protein [Streptomyces parvus]
MEVHRAALLIFGGLGEGESQVVIQSRALDARQVGQESADIANRSVPKLSRMRMP